MKTVIFCLMTLLLLGVPISGKATILENNAALRVKSSSMSDGVSKITVEVRGSNPRSPTILK
jgi:hypothetical protein